MTAKKTGLELLRVPFEAKHINRLPKPTKAQTDALKQKPDGYKLGIRCEECGGWHHPKVVHLDYVGHAAMTDRLLDTDPLWTWEPLATTESGLPAFDEIGGLWIRLHVLEHNRIGYGSADGKTGGNAKKEVIGDAIRNAAMRFGAALDLWHKGDLHDDAEEPEKEEKKVEEEKPSYKPKDGKYHPSALVIHEDRAGTPDMLFQLIMDELKQSDNAKEMWDASTYAPPKDCEMVSALFLLKKREPELYAELRTEAGALFGSEQ